MLLRVSPMVRSCFLFVTFASFLGSCSGPQNSSDNQTSAAPQEGSAPTTHTWQKGACQVRFAAGPQQHLPEGGQKSFSTFEIHHKKEGRALATAVTASAIGIESMVYDPRFKITDHVKIHVSPSEQRLLISENVPNDCCPCANYVLCELIGEELKTTYLEFPEWRPPVDPSLPLSARGPMFMENPTILTLGEDEVEFEFSDKKVRKVKMRDLPRLSNVKFPG